METILYQKKKRDRYNFRYLGVILFFQGAACISFPYSSELKKEDIEYYDALVFKCASDQTGIVTRMRSQRSRSLSGTLVCEMKSNTWSREMLEQIGREEGREEGCEKNGGSGGREKHTVERMRNRESREERERKR